MDTKPKQRSRPRKGVGRSRRPGAILVNAKFVRPDRMELEFSDGLSGTWSFRQLDLDMKHMRMATIKASRSGKFVDLKSKSGDHVQLDSSWLRALIDPEYAAEMERRLDNLANPLAKNKLRN